MMLTQVAVDQWTVRLNNERIGWVLARGVSEPYYRAYLAHGEMLPQRFTSPQAAAEAMRASREA